MARLTLDDVLNKLQAESAIQEVTQTDRVLGGLTRLEDGCHPMGPPA